MHQDLEPRRRGPLWPALVWLAVIAAVTLTPGGGGGSPTGWCIFCGHRGFADFLLNIGLFLPLGMALAWRGVPFRWAAAVACAATVGIEAAQLSLVPGRDSNPGDVLANTTGGVLGWWVLARGRPWAEQLGRRGVTSGLAAAAVTVSLLLGVTQLFRPDIPRGTYFTQWAADFAHMGRFDGEVLSTRVGGLSLDGPPWEIQRSDSVRTLLERRADVAVEMVPGTVPRGIAPIFSIYDDQQREILMVAQADGDMLFRHRLLASRLLLDGADLRGWGLLDGLRPGRPARLAVQYRGRAFCLAAGDAERCGLAFSPGDTWMLLYAPDWLDPPLRDAVSALWLLALFVPTGAFVRSRRTALVVVPAAVAGLALGSWLTGFPIPPVLELLGAAAGIAAGALWTRR